MNGGGKISSVADRIRGGIAAVLTLTTFTLANYATDQRWQAVFMICGLLYFMTLLYYMFKDVD